MSGEFVVIKLHIFNEYHFKLNTQTMGHICCETCQSCRYKWGDNPQDILNHIRRRHGSEAYVTYICDHDNYSFNSVYDLIEHGNTL